MKSDPLEELKTSIRQAGAVRRGEKPAQRVWRLTKQPDGTVKRELVSPKTHQKEQAARWNAANEVTDIRKTMGMSQTEFAVLLGISVRTLHHWEQGSRQPSGAAKVLLRVAQTEPKILKRVLAKA
jgi:putative transcriptional regulator